MIVPAEERTRVLIVAGIALFFVLVWFNYSAVLPLVVEEWDLSGTQAGIVFGAFQAGYLVAFLTLAAGASLGLLSVGVLTRGRRWFSAPVRTTLGVTRWCVKRLGLGFQ